jgi:hypothetical protein
MSQRRTSTGVGRPYPDPIFRLASGRTEKTAQGTAKNPRLLKACNITKTGDMGEFFFISVVFMAPALPGRRQLKKSCHRKEKQFPGLWADLSLIFL